MSQKLWVVIGAQSSDIRRIVLLEALKKAAEDTSITLDIGELLAGASAPNFSMNPVAGDQILLLDIDANEITPLAGETHSLSSATLLADVAGTLVKYAGNTAAPSVAAADLSGEDQTPSRVKKIVAITSCPTGIAHTFMAAEGLQNAAKALGIEIRVETQGSVGAQDALTRAEIEAADIVMITADREVDRARFGGKRVFSSGTKAAINDGQNLIKRAIIEAKLQRAGDDRVTEDSGEAVQTAGPYKHLMNGVSFMLPFVVAGGLMIALAFALGGIHAGDAENAGTLAYALSMIGGSGGFALMVPVLAGYISFSIADRPGLAPGMIGGLIAAEIGSGFLGGIVAGFFAGYLVRWLNRTIKLPRNLEGLKPVLILPLLGTAIVGLIMIYVVGEPVSLILKGLESWLRGMQGASALVLGAVIGGMMAVDMGGPVNKAAYATSVALISTGVYEPMAAVMAAGMVPPLAAALATRVFKGKFTKDEYEAAPATAVLGLAFISEGAIPYAARDPLRVIPSFIAGAAVTGAISMVVGSQLHAPHGGIFVLFIPGAITHVGGYLIALIAGTLVSACLLGVFKKRVEIVS